MNNEILKIDEILSEEPIASGEGYDIVELSVLFTIGGEWYDKPLKAKIYIEHDEAFEDAWDYGLMNHTTVTLGVDVMVASVEILNKSDFTAKELAALEADDFKDLKYYIKREINE